MPAVNDHACGHAQPDSDSHSDEYEQVGNKTYNVISGKSLCHGFEMSTCNALSRNGLQMIFTGCLAAFPGTQLRILVDTGANWSFVSQKLIDKHDLKLTDSPIWMKLADGNKALSQGTCKLAFEYCDYKATVFMLALKMNSDFAVVLGCDWLQKNRAYIMLSTDSLHIGCARSDGQTYDWPFADDGVCHSVKCSTVAGDDMKNILMLMTEFHIACQCF